MAPAARSKGLHRADFGPVQALEHTGLTAWQWDAGTAARLIPAPDVGGRRRSRAVAGDVAARREAIVTLGDPDAPTQTADGTRTWQLTGTGATLARERRARRRQATGGAAEADR